jgi:signal transduction histidine kinase/ligand-binding sensor domain-containing protein/DNA-binding response OmpR family regulator
LIKYLQVNQIIRSYSLAIPIAFICILKVSGVDFPYTSSFGQISQKDGLPNNLVECIIQDHTGYLWFGTKRGLCKYDGYDFTNYRSDINDSTSLPYHHITSLLETSDSTLWVGVWRNGLCKYKRDKNSFSEVIPQKTSFPKTLTIHQLYEDSKNRIWAIHQYGISIFSLSGDVLNEMAPSFRHGDNQVSAIFETKDNELLISAGGNIYSYNSKLQSFEEIEYTCYVSTGNIHQFHQYNDHTLWLATDYGLLEYNLSQNTIYPLLQSQDAPFKFILEDEQENIWFGGSSTIRYDKRIGQIHHFDELSGQDGPISGNSLTCGIVDSQKNLWFGNTHRGASVLYNKSAHFDYSPEVQKFLKDNSIDVTSAFRNKEGMLFIGTDNKGILMFDKNGKKIDIGAKYPCLSNLESKPGVVHDIKSDPNGNIWFGSGGDSGITVYSPKNNRCEQYDKAVSSFLFDSSGNTWIGVSYGLVLFDAESKQFTLYQSNNLATQGIADMLEDREGKIWIASHDNGFFITKIHEKRLVKANETFSNLPDTKGISLLEDSRGRMWLGTEFYGLFYKDSDQDQFNQFTQKDGLPSNDICSILEDKNGSIWIATNHGLSRFDYTSGRFKNYFIGDGLSGDEFNFNAFFMDENGALLFGTTNGLVAFDPDQIEDDDQPLPLVINEVSINNGRVSTDVFGLSVNEALNSHKPLTLKHDQNTIHIEFSTINFSSSKKSQFAYMLKGSDEGYDYVGEDRQVNYTKLPPGEYLFSVKASNNDNVWGENEATFSFSIRRHPMKSIIAYILYSLFLCLIAVIVFRIIAYQNQLKNAVIIEQMAKKQQDDLVKMKLRFFTNISHEFKTPLSLIISPLEELINELHGNSSIKRKLTQIRRNSQRLLTLINQLIEFRKMEQDVLPVKREELNLVEITRNAMMLFSDLAEQRSIYFELKTGMLECRIISDKDKIEKVFNNLLSNAFKYTPENGTITVSLTLVKNHVQVSIKDTGTGISEKSLKHIFDRFYQEKHSDQISGIGLAYVNKIVELLDGTIEVQSKIDQGTEVIFTIPEANQMPVVEVFNQSETQNQDQTDEFGKIKPEKKSKEDEAKPDAPSILVVEDDYEIRKNLCSMLQNAYNVDEAENGLAAYELILHRAYNLVISDIMMPKMNGLELCSKIKSNPQTNHMIVVLLSAKDELESEMEGYKTGANIYLSKPFLPQKLLSIIKNQLYTQQKAITHHTDTHSDDSKQLIGVNLKEQEFFDQVSLFIEKNLHNQDFGIDKIGEEFGLSRSKLYKKFKAITNVSLKDFIREVRMKKAASLLNENMLTASEIAYNLGFSSATNFFTAFKAYYGKTPKEFQKEEIQ